MKPEEFLSALLGRHQIVRIVVLPCMCKGLHGFAPVQPLPLNLGHQLKPDMNISAAPTGLDFVASFGGERRAVTVPWEALLFAGTPEQFSQLLAERQPEAKPVTEVNGNVIHVDFSKKKA